MKRRMPEVQYLVQGQHPSHTELLLLLDTVHLLLKHQEDMEHLHPPLLEIMEHLLQLPQQEIMEHPLQLPRQEIMDPLLQLPRQEIMEHPPQLLQLEIMEPPLQLPQQEIMEPLLQLPQQEIMEHPLHQPQLVIMEHLLQLHLLVIMEHQLPLPRPVIMEHQHLPQLLIMGHPLHHHLKIMEPLLPQQLITMEDPLMIMTMIITTLLPKYQTVTRLPNLPQILTLLLLILSNHPQPRLQISTMHLGQQVDTVLLPQPTKPPEEGGNSTDLRP